MARLLVSPWFAGVIALAGCGPASKSVRKIAPRGRPAHFRLVNLTDSPVSAMIGNTYPIGALAPGAMTGALPVRPGRRYKVTVQAGVGSMTLEQATEAGRFATVVVSSDGLSGFVSGRSLSDPTAPVVDFVNLTDKPRTFKSGSSRTFVAPRSSQSVGFAIGAASFSSGVAKTLETKMDKAQIWAVYATQEKGALVLRISSLKGAGGVAGSGASGF